MLSTILIFSPGARRVTFAKLRATRSVRRVEAPIEKPDSL